MMDLTEVEGFEWDEGNERKSLDKHGVSREECMQLFFSEYIFLLEDAKHSIKEKRFIALGVTTAGRMLFIAFTVRRKKIRVISARDMNKKERRLLYEEIKKDSQI